MAFLNLQQLEKTHRRFSAAHHAAVEDEAEAAGKFGVAYAKQRPRFKPRTGKLQAGNDYRVIHRGGKSLRVALSNREKYAAAIDKGARPHKIFGRRGPLRFKTNGRWVSKWSVNHPGNRPFKFLHSATTAAGASFQSSMASRMTVLARKF